MSDRHPLIPHTHWFQYVTLMSLVITLSVVLLNFGKPRSLNSQAKGRFSRIQNQECVVAGCSNQLCVAKGLNGIITSCEWKDEYSCYQNYGNCELQTSGKCGWTPSEELTSCLGDTMTELPEPIMLEGTPAPYPTVGPEAIPSPPAPRM